MDKLVWELQFMLFVDLHLSVPSSSGNLCSGCCLQFHDDSMALSTLFRALTDPKNLSRGKIVHCKIIVSCLLPDVITSNHLMSMYAKFGLLDDARWVFDEMPYLNVVSWSILINAHSKIGSAMDAIDCFRLMVSGGFQPNDFTYVSVLYACAKLIDVKPCKEIHGRVYRFENVLSNRFVGNSLMNSYSKCGFVCSARKVFDQISQPNLVSWSSLISGHCQFGEHEEALRIFLRAQQQGLLGCNHQGICFRRPWRESNMSLSEAELYWLETQRACPAIHSGWLLHFPYF